MRPASAGRDVALALRVFLRRSRLEPDISTRTGPRSRSVRARRTSLSPATTRGWSPTSGSSGSIAGRPSHSQEWHCKHCCTPYEQRSRPHSSHDRG
jgi:hypothetical protein